MILGLPHDLFTLVTFYNSPLFPIFVLANEQQLKLLQMNISLDHLAKGGLIEIERIQLKIPWLG